MIGLEIIKRINGLFTSRHREKMLFSAKHRKSKVRLVRSCLAMIFFFLLFINSISNAQYFTKEKVAYLFTSIAYPLLEGYTEGLQVMEKHTVNGAERLSINREWHKWKGFEEFSAIAVGITIGFDSELNFWKIMSDLFLSAALYWIIHDEMINRTNGWNIGFGYTSDFDTGQFLHKIASPYIKIPILGLAFAANALIFSE